MNAAFRKLTGLLESNDLDLRTAAIRVIAEIGLSSRPVIQSLGKCLKEPHDELRLHALRALATLGARDVAHTVVPLVLTAGPLREQALAVISAIGPSVVPQLRTLYGQADFHGKRSVVSALSRIGGHQAIHFLLKILPEEPFELQKHLAICVCESLDRMTPAQQAPIFPMVLRLFRQKDPAQNPQIPVTAAIILGHFRGQRLAIKARNVLRGYTEARWPPEVRRHAFMSFNRLVGEAKLSSAEEQFLWKTLLDEDWHNAAQHALQGFSKITLAKKQLPKLVTLLEKSPHFSVHIHVFERLQGSEDPEVAEAILPFLADSRYRVREAAEAALRKMPTSIESLFQLLMRTEDLEVTQRINAILRDYPQETRQKYVERAAARLLSLFEDNDPHYKSFLEFVKTLDPEPLRKRIYEKVHALKKGKVKDRWEKIAGLLQILWDNHLITAEGRYLLAVALVCSSSKDLAPASRRANLGLRVLRALIYDDHAALAKRLLADKDLTAEDYFYFGFHFAEEGEDLRPFSTLMLEHVVKHFPKSKVAPPAAQKLELQAKAMEEARLAKEQADAAEAKKALRKQRREERALAALNEASAGGGGARPGGAKPAVAAAPARAPAVPGRKPEPAVAKQAPAAVAVAKKAPATAAKSRPAAPGKPAARPVRAGPPAKKVGHGPAAAKKRK